MNWTDVSWNQYLEILEIFEDKDLGESDRVIELCKVLYGINILQLPMTEYNKYIGGLKFLNTQPPKLPLMEEYTVNDTVYTVTTDVANLTVAQYFDVDAYIKQSKDVDNYVKIMSVFFIPKGKKYNEGYKTADVIEDMGELPVPVVLSLSAFFLKFWRTYIKISQRFLWLKTRKMPKPMRKKLREELKKMEQTMDSVYSVY